MSPPHLTHTFTLRVQAGPSSSSLHFPPSQPNPTRHITPVIGGFLHGIPGTRAAGLTATLLPGGSDWVLRDDTKNILHLDVRTQARTSSGQGVYIQYTGHLVLDEATERFMRRDEGAGSTAFGGHEWWITPHFEIGDPEYEWVQRGVFFGRGRFHLEGEFRGVEYEIFEVRN
ncbi:DUF3237 domain-containing protein [Aspergillus ibericus CBS 121593]|uniref:DUF3237 domain protein n=1 Tax=Aspergillus ibericus CBS 121593 TaxID=1448316 RepID=A0A395GJJ9_9EURO|nr:hypothetical protein BO80DRAFT_368131 [Aspergillus ibericus CBS 121593]RAK95661.1 hypothetical protein BO80DRAFT_368131 [Aspergillus ibericus CBS 121593]